MKRLSLVVFVACSCRLLPAPIPMAKIVEAHHPGGHAQCLVLLLPGAGDHASTFREQGFVQLLEGSGASLDIVTADATMGYYFRGIAPERIELDVAAEARALGAAHVWVIGMSMGGFGALSYAEQYPEHVDGVLALAPYLGSSSIADEARGAGGLKVWPADPKGPITEATYQRQLWSWLHRVVSTEEKGPALYLGWGDDDSLGVPASVVAAALPASHVFHTPGGHDWSPWKALLTQFLATPEFETACKAPTNGVDSPSPQ